ncbi:MAG: sulfite exporter TauE/SafE family protein [Planctomycetes bacterium]|nr:sulfite exporter TauE/SafE family protein [Planctomycetota bacterium]MCB9829977.1 sulfite exporter TauE/SafE family protein [Planctomycetota bacterium]MCB9900687.1 sulfite exporter TauE/SafE family protein [Planctomycetota bacterium]
MEILLYVGLVLLGFAAGTLGSLLGLGGGFLVVPALILLRGMDDRLATGTSIAVIVPAMLTALWRRGAQGDVDFAVAAWVAVGAVGGAFLGSHIARTIDPTTLRRLFAGILVVLAFVLVMKKPPARTPAPATSGAGDAGQLPPNLAGPPMGGDSSGDSQRGPGTPRRS